METCYRFLLEKMELELLFRLLSIEVLAFDRGLSIEALALVGREKFAPSGVLFVRLVVNADKYLQYSSN